MKEAIREYLLSGEQRGWSRATVEQYAWHLGRFSDWLGDRNLSRRLLLEYAVSLRKRYARATERVAVIALRGFLARYAPEFEDVLHVPRSPGRVQRTVTACEVQALLDTCDRRPVTSGLTAPQAAATAARNAAIIATLYDSLLRAGELCRLRLDDVDVVSRRLLVRGKGGEESLVRFGPSTAVRLRAWLALRPGFADAGTDAVFVAVGGNSPGQPLTTTGLRIIINKLCRRAGVELASPHAFRRGGTVAAIENGAPSRLVQAWGRWSDIRMVEVYTRNLEAGKLFDQYSPMERLNGDT